MNLKRLWDVTNKRIAYVKGPTGHECQLWVDMNTMKMYIYDMSQWIEYTQNVVNDGMTYGSMWEVINSDDEMGVYDTSKPTDTFTWESGDEVSYAFKDWDGTVLKEGKVKEGTKPTAPADPTRTGYTFTGWNPEVAKITKKTTYTATYEINTYTVTVSSNDDTYGTVDVTEVEADYGTAISASDNVLTIGSTTITATAESGYEFDTWGDLPATVTSDLTITATFKSEVYITINQETSDTTGYVGGQVTVYYESNGTGYLMSDNPDIMEVDSSSGVYGSSTVFNVLQAGTTTLTITAIKDGHTASDTIQIVCTEPPVVIPVNAVNFSVEEDVDNPGYFRYTAAKIFQIGPGTTGTSTNNKPAGADYITFDGTIAIATGAYASNAKFTALAADSGMMGYINTGLQTAVANDTNWDETMVCHLFFNAPYWTALNTYFSNSTPDLATLKSTFATLIGNSVDMFVGDTSYQPVNVSCVDDEQEELITVKFFDDGDGNYLEMECSYSEDNDEFSERIVRLTKYDTNIGVVIKSILDKSWEGDASDMTNKYNTVMAALFNIIDCAYNLVDESGTWSGELDLSVGSAQTHFARLWNGQYSMSVGKFYGFAGQIETGEVVKDSQV